MNVYPTSTIMSTDIAEDIIKLEQELVVAQRIGARTETTQSLESRLKQAHEQKVEEEQQKDIKFIKSWSNQFLIKQYKQAKETANELEQKAIDIDLLTSSERQPEIEAYEAQVKVIEQVEDEGQARCIPPFIADEVAENTVLRTLAELIGTEGYMPASKVAEKCSYPVSEVKNILENLYSTKKILRYDEGTDSWAASLKTRQELGFAPIG